MCVLVKYYQRLNAHQALPLLEDEDDLDDDIFRLKNLNIHIESSLSQQSPHIVDDRLEETKTENLQLRPMLTHNQPDAVVTSLLEMLNTSPSMSRRGAIDTQGVIEWEPLSQRILSHALSVFINEFSDVLTQTRPSGDRFASGL